MKPKLKKPKKLSYRLIDQGSVAGQLLYPMLAALVARYHEDLRDARIALAWNLSWKPDVDGRVTLGKCKRASELDRELAAFDFVIILRQEFFEDGRVSDEQRRALIDHELCHAAVKYDENGERVVDERGRTVYRTRKHDLEEFAEIADRYGCWKGGIEAFALALERSKSRTPSWVGFSGLQQHLADAGMIVSIESVRAWTADERREAETWALLKTELDTRKQPAGSTMTLICPEFVRAAVGESVATS